MNLILLAARQLAFGHADVTQSGTLLFRVRSYTRGPEGPIWSTHVEVPGQGLTWADTGQCRLRDGFTRLPQSRAVSGQTAGPEIAALGVL